MHFLKTVQLEHDSHFYSTLGHMLIMCTHSGYWIWYCRNRKNILSAVERKLSSQVKCEMITDISGRYFVRHRLSGDEEGDDFITKYFWVKLKGKNWQFALLDSEQLYLMFSNPSSIISFYRLHTSHASKCSFSVVYYEKFKSNLANICQLHAFRIFVHLWKPE
jgi:hypothetical protein